MSMARRPREVFKPHPVLGWTLSPDARVMVPYRRHVVQTIGPDSWRTVAAPDGPTGATLAVYGCSFVYGTGLADRETFTALLQASLKHVRILNRGIGGHGTLQNYLQFRRDLLGGQVQAAVFGVMSDHRFRNIPHPQRMHQLQQPGWYELGVEHVPTVRQDRQGELSVDYVSLWQPCLKRRDFDVFLPNDHMIDQATLCVLRTIVVLAARHGVPIVFALLDQLDLEFNQQVLDSFPQALDISIPIDADHSFLPHDPHPNVRANQLYASRLLPRINAMDLKTTRSN